jgi:hypothetical protein
MIVDTMIPEAFPTTHNLAGLITSAAIGWGRLRQTQIVQNLQPVRADICDGVIFNFAIWAFGGSYRVIDNDPVTLDLLAGGRLWNLDGKAKLSGPVSVQKRSGSDTWVDPIIGISGRVGLGSGFALQAEADVGGFGLVSDINWQVLGTLQYQVSDSVTLDADYRYLGLDYKNGGFLWDVGCRAVRADHRRKHSLLNELVGDVTV